VPSSTPRDHTRAGADVTASGMCRLGSGRFKWDFRFGSEPGPARASAIAEARLHQASGGFPVRESHPSDLSGTRALRSQGHRLLIPETSGATGRVRDRGAGPRILDSAPLRGNGTSDIHVGKRELPGDRPGARAHPRRRRPRRGGGLVALLPGRWRRRLRGRVEAVARIGRSSRSALSSVASGTTVFDRGGFPSTVRHRRQPPCLGA